MGSSELAFIVSIVLFRVAPLVLVPVGAYYLFARSEMGRALIDRWRRDSSELPPLVEQEILRLREELMEVHERLDFAERMLVELRNTGQLPPVAASRQPTPPERTKAR